MKHFLKKCYLDIQYLFDNYNSKSRLLVQACFTCFTHVKRPQISLPIALFQFIKKSVLKIDMLSKIKNLFVTINYGKQSKAQWYYIVNFFCSSTTSLPDWVLLGDETHMANLLGRKRESTIYDWAQLFNEPSKSLCRSPKRQSDLFSPNTPQPLRFGQY